jgi:hypothetical protein
MKALIGESARSTSLSARPDYAGEKTHQKKVVCFQTTVDVRS